MLGFVQHYEENLTPIWLKFLNILQASKSGDSVNMKSEVREYFGSVKKVISDDCTLALKQPPAEKHFFQMTDASFRSARSPSWSRIIQSIKFSQGENVDAAGVRSKKSPLINWKFRFRQKNSSHYIGHFLSWRPFCGNKSNQWHITNQSHIPSIQKPFRQLCRTHAIMFCNSTSRKHTLRVKSKQKLIFPLNLYWKLQWITRWNSGKTYQQHRIWWQRLPRKQQRRKSFSSHKQTMERRPKPGTGREKQISEQIGIMGGKHGTTLNDDKYREDHKDRWKKSVIFHHRN